MENFQYMISAGVQLMKIPFTLWGFTFSWWEIMLAVAVFSLVIWFVFTAFLSD